MMETSPPNLLKTETELPPAPFQPLRFWGLLFRNMTADPL